MPTFNDLDLAGRAPRPLPVEAFGPSTKISFQKETKGCLTLRCAVIRSKDPELPDPREPDACGRVRVLRPADGTTNLKGSDYTPGAYPAAPWRFDP